MTSKDLIKIIESAKLSGLTYIKFGDIEMRFGAGDAAEAGAVRVDSQGPQEIIENPEDDRLKLVQAQADIEEELNTLQIDDPVAFEDLIMQREIEIGREEAP